MRSHIFLFALCFLAITMFIFGSMNTGTIDSILVEINRPFPTMPVLNTQWYEGGIFVDIASALGWIGQIIGCIGAKIGSGFQLIYVFLNPASFLGSDYFFVTAINSVVLIMLIYSLIPMEGS